VFHHASQTQAHQIVSADLVEVWTSAYSHRNLLGSHHQKHHLSIRPPFGGEICIFTHQKITRLMV